MLDHSIIIIIAESFAERGTLHVVNCSFDGNENGIFVPGHTGNGANVDLVVRNSIFSRDSPNGTSITLTNWFWYWFLTILKGTRRRWST